jgi:hypothetical protein
VEFELIKSIISFFKAEEDKEIVQLAKDKLTTFITSKDPNCKLFQILNLMIVKYLGLITLKDILNKEKHLISEYK